MTLSLIPCMVVRTDYMKRFMAESKFQQPYVNPLIELCIFLPLALPTPAAKSAKCFATTISKGFQDK